MPTPFPYPDRDELPEVIEVLGRAAESYLADIDERPVVSERVAEALAVFQAPLPEEGVGAVRSIERLLGDGLDGSATTSGPRCFHFVIGGSTPAALGADWLTTLLDQIAYTWVVSPLGVELEMLALDWLKDLFGLPAGLAGVMTTGGTMSNFVGLAAARQWWGEQQGVDISEDGWSDLPPLAVLSSGYMHASAAKVLGLLGVGRSSVTRCVADGTGRLDLEALEGELGALEGRPAVMIATAGEPNVGGFDPIEAMVDLAASHNVWLHVDGAFGLFARLSPSTAHLAAGVEHADSVAVDGHKWLNVPYDCGFAFVRDGRSLGRAFRYTADYLPDPDDPRPTLGGLGPESSRRARSLAVWATLQAYGRAGYRELIETHVALAKRLAGRVDDAEDLERLAEPLINVVCFRFNPGGLDEAELDALNERLGEAVLADGRVYVGTTRYDGRVALRPAIANWRTRESDVDLFVDVIRGLGHRLTRSGTTSGDAGDL